MGGTNPPHGRLFWSIFAPASRSQAVAEQASVFGVDPGVQIALRQGNCARFHEDAVTRATWST
jgi:hypothetical protein